ncbi:MAG: hypothetical protein JSW39_15950, partial [Desulfobacterales bacterium]
PALENLLAQINRFDPWSSLVLFLAASFFMLWRLGAMERKGIEGTVLGTLIMPYSSGFSNLIFALVLGRAGGSGSLVLENCLVNNVTNLTLLVGLPAIFWSMHVLPPQNQPKKGRGDAKIYRLNYLSLLLTLIALMFFTGVLWALARDGKLDFGDGLVLVGLFLFWQILHVFEVLKNNVRQRRTLSWLILIDWLLIVAGGYGVYVSIERLVAWIPKAGSGLFVFANLGWLSGFLMVLPNALLAIYYAGAGRPDIVYSSQAGDGHICIPMCIGLFALFSNITIPSFFILGVLMILAAGLVHFLFIALWGRLPRFMGWVLTGVYGLFVYEGLIR